MCDFRPAYASTGTVMAADLYRADITALAAQNALEFIH